jgi:hypothetical protein
LNPLRRVAAFFAFLGILTLSSCGEDPESPAALMNEQTRIFNEMADVINQVAEGGDQEAAAQKITSLGKELKALKVRLAEALSERKNEELKSVAGKETFFDATAAYQKAQENLFRSGRNTAEFTKALAAHHNLAPMTGEGTP